MTMETTENKIEVTYQEAYVNRLFLNVEFIFNGVELIASGVYYTNCGIEDIEVMTADDWVYFEYWDEQYKEGKKLLEEMDLHTHLTF